MKSVKRISITIKPTNDCNMRCKHCYHAEEGFDSEMLNPAYAKKMIDIAVKEYEEIHIVFHGGEPTLWGLNNLVNVLEYERSIEATNPNIKFKNIIQTNGVLLNDEWINVFKEYSIVVGISYDGPHNDDLRANSEVVYDNMLRMKEMGLSFGVLCVESAKSINNLEATYEWFNKEGFSFKVLALFMSGTALEHQEFEINIDEYVDNLAKVYRLWLYDKNCHISMRTFEDLLKVSDKLYCIQYGGSCIHNRICLNPNGDIYPCGRPYTDDFILGNIKDLELISDAFKTPAYKNLVDISAERAKQCREKCDYFGVCKGGCVSSAILEGSFDKINNTTCVRAKKLLAKITKINNEIYALYDEGKHLEEFNPIALKIMKKIRTGKYNFTK
ncbi:radical SAM/SPASM domain-containing protein [Mobilitalea sibirica]|uniref:radical SAM/SPASM domain-containing protein n=1 Tax=Mobilitalea sibirica TaxID=1462919 RepID=UPI002ECFCD72